MKIFKKVKRKLLGQQVIPPVDFRLQQLNKILDEGLGHKLSATLQKPVDAAGKPLPWFTYPAIEYLQQLDLSATSILEWGIGNSSLFFASRCKQLMSVEHNKEWFDLIKNDLPSNARAVFAAAEEYAVLPISTNQQFDVIVVDGIERADCVVTAVKLLTATGMIIFDNAERYPDLCKYLRDQDLIEIDFHGYGPINPYAWTTSLFLRRGWNVAPLSHQPIVPAGGGH